MDVYSGPTVFTVAVVVDSKDPNTDLLSQWIKTVDDAAVEGGGGEMKDAGGEKDTKQHQEDPEGNPKVDPQQQQTRTNSLGIMTKYVSKSRCGTWSTWALLKTTQTAMHIFSLDVSSKTAVQKVAEGLNVVDLLLVPSLTLLEKAMARFKHQRRFFNIPLYCPLKDLPTTEFGAVEVALPSLVQGFVTDCRNSSVEGTSTSTPTTPSELFAILSGGGVILEKIPCSPDVDGDSSTGNTDPVWQKAVWGKLVSKCEVQTAKVLEATRPAAKQEKEDVSPPSARIIKVQRFSRLKVTHIKVLSGTLVVGDRVAGASEVNTLHIGNRIISMQTYMDGTPLLQGGKEEKATAGMHVAIQCEGDNEVKANGKIKWYTELDRKVHTALSDRTLETVPPFALLSKANTIVLSGQHQNYLATVPVYVVLAIHKDCPLLKDLRPRQNLGLEAWGGHSVSHVVGISAPLKTGVVRIGLTMDFNRSVAVTDCFPQETPRAVVWPESDCSLRFHVDVVAQLNQLALHRRTVELHKQQLSEEKEVANGMPHSQEVLAARATLTSVLDRSHPMFSMVQTEGETLLSQALFLEVTRNVANGEHFFTDDDVEEDGAEEGGAEDTTTTEEGPLVVTKRVKRREKIQHWGYVKKKKTSADSSYITSLGPTIGKIFSLLNLLAWDSELYAKALAKVELNVVVANIRHVTMEWTVRVVAESCGGCSKNGKMNSVKEWLKIQGEKIAEHEATKEKKGALITTTLAIALKSAGRLLFDALLAIGDAHRVMLLVRDSPNSVDAAVMKKIFTSERLPRYVLLFVALYTPMANHRSMTVRNQVKDMSPATCKTVKDWIGPLYLQQKQSQCDTFSLKAAALRYYLTWAFRTSPTKRVIASSSSFFSPSASIGLYDGITGYNLHLIFLYLDCDIE